MVQSNKKKRGFGNLERKILILPLFNPPFGGVII
jgi:hypothetical protein